MRYGSLFETSDVENLTHEVLDHHGFKSSNGHYVRDERIPDMPEPGKGSHHDDLKAIGWRHISSIPGISTQNSLMTVYRHPGNRRDLFIRDVDATQDGDGNYHHTIRFVK